MFTSAIMQSFSYPSTIEGYAFDLDGTLTGVADLTYPAGILENDLILVVLNTTENGATAWATPSGYTELHEENGVGIITAVQYKIADGTETGVESFSSTGNGRKAAIMLVIRGANVAAPINDWSLFVDPAPAAFPGDYEVSDVTTTVSGCRGIVFALSAANGAPTMTLVPMTGYTHIVDAGNGTLVHAFSSTLDDMGGTGTYGGTVNWDNGGGSNTAIHNYFLAIAPA